jgi:uncharacterized protein YqjF (DUF2071 family)
MTFRLIHPVPMKTLFRRCVLANFEMDPDILASRLPDHLTPDVHHGKAFVSVVIADMEKMRPSFLPRIAGTTYNQVVYRAVVKCGNHRGVTFLRSDADSSFMVTAGNLLTFFRFHRANATWRTDESSIEFDLVPRDGAAAAINLSLDRTSMSSEMPAESGFRDLNDAQSFLTELYMAFGNRCDDGRVETVRIERSSWDGQVFRDRVARYEAMTGGDLFGPDETRLNSVFFVEDLNYHWKRLSFTIP